MIPKYVKFNLSFKITTLFAGYSILSFILCFLIAIVAYLTMDEVDKIDRFLRFKIVYFLAIGLPLIISGMVSWFISVFLGIVLIIKNPLIVSTRLFVLWLSFILFSLACYIFYIWERSLYGVNILEIIKDYCGMFFTR